MGITTSGNVANWGDYYNGTYQGPELVNMEQDTPDLWGSGLLEPEIEKVIAFNLLAEDSDRYFLTGLGILGNKRRFPVAQSTFEWGEFNASNFRKGVTAITNTPTIAGTPTVTVKTGNTELYYLVGDVLQNSLGKNFKVTANVIDAGEEQLTLKPIIGGNVLAGDVAQNMPLGFITTSFPEHSDAPGSRRWRPERMRAALGIIRKNDNHSGSAASSRSELKVGNEFSWVSANQMITLADFYTDLEGLLAFSQPNLDSAVGDLRPYGLLSNIRDNGFQHTYTGTVTETDYQTMFLTADPAVVGKEWLQIIGSAQFYESQTALKEYFAAGAVDYGQFSETAQILAGFSVRGYRWGDALVMMKRHRLLDNDAITGSATAGANAIDYKHSSFWLDMSENSRGLGANPSMPKVSFAYKSGGGLNRAFVVGRINGMTGRGNGMNMTLDGQANKDMFSAVGARNVSTMKDGDEFGVLAEWGVRAIGVQHCHGFMRKNGA